MMMNLDGKRILVTGASSGIGAAVAVSASKLGAELVVTGRKKDKLEDTFRQLHGKGHSAVPWDLSDIKTIGNFMEEACANRKLHGLVHAAGATLVRPVGMLTYEQNLSLMNINYFSFIELVKFFSKKKYSDGGSIVGISSASSVKGLQGMSIYSATKAAMDASVRCLALELAKKHIRVNTILPAYVDTDMYVNIKEQIGETSINEILKKQLFGLLEAEDVANTVLFLLSDLSKRITGSAIAVDSGYLVS